MDGHTNAVISLLVVNRLMYTGSADGTAKEQQNMFLTKHILSVSLSFHLSIYLSLYIYLVSIYFYTNMIYLPIYISLALFM